MRFEFSAAFSLKTLLIGIFQSSFPEMLQLSPNAPVDESYIAACTQSLPTGYVPEKVTLSASTPPVLYIQLYDASHSQMNGQRH